MTSASTGAAPSSWRARFAGGAAVRLESLIVLAVLCVAMAMLSNAFLSVSNILNILLSTSVFGTLAIGMTFVISSAGIDLSVGSILALSGVVGAILTSNLGSHGGSEFWVVSQPGRLTAPSTDFSSPGAQSHRSSLRSACSASRAVSHWC